MRIAMFTNTYLPHVGGVARSVERFTRGYRARDHEVRIVAPAYAEQPEGEEGVVRVPALDDVIDSGFAAPLSLGGDLADVMGDFAPEIVHAHHPYLIGTAALRIAGRLDTPAVFTHHTMYEHYVHYAPVEIPGMGRFVVELATGFANLCDAVVAPSESVAGILRERGVETAVRVIPTGVDVADYAAGDGASARRHAGVPEDAFVVGHVGRLAPEKNLDFLGRAMARFLAGDEARHALIVGDGPSHVGMRRVFDEAGVAGRAHFPGVRKGQDLVDAYHAMDVFAFTSKTETQGMVLVEALAAGCPVVALDAPGAREVVSDGACGALAEKEDEAAFAATLERLADLPKAERAALGARARDAAEPFDTDRSVEKTLALYRETAESHRPSPRFHEDPWAALVAPLRREWNLWENRLRALADMVAYGRHP